MKRSLVAVILFCAFAACHAAGGGRTAPRLVIADAREPRTLNTLLLEGPAATTLDPLIYSYLLEYDDRGNLVPDLASNVPSRANGGISADGLTITYRLRKNAKWQDGVPVTSRDVVFTFRSIMNTRNNVMSRFGYDRVRDVTSVEPYILRVRLRAPYSSILSNFFAPDQNYGILPEHLLRTYTDLNEIPFNAKPIGSGPYRVAEWARGDHLTLVRNALYFRGTPAIETITLKFIANSNTILDQLRTGEVTAYFFADPSHMAEYASNPKTKIVRAPFAGFGVLLFNTTDAPVATAANRRAIASALDVPALVRNATKNTQTAQDANRGLFSWAYDSTATPPPYDPVHAKNELQAAGVHSLSLIYESGIATSASVAVQVQQQLHDAGVDVALRAYTPQMFRAPASAGGPWFGGKFSLSFLEVYNTVDPNTQWVLGCADIPPNGFNTMRYCDPVVERAQDADVKTYDRQARIQIASVIQHRVVEQLPMLPLWAQNAIYVVPKNLHGFRPSPTSPYSNVGEWSLSSL